ALGVSDRDLAFHLLALTGNRNQSGADCPDRQDVIGDPGVDRGAGHVLEEGAGLVLDDDDATCTLYRDHAGGAVAAGTAQYDPHDVRSGPGRRGGEKPVGGGPDMMIGRFVVEGQP